MSDTNTMNPPKTTALTPVAEAPKRHKLPSGWKVDVIAVRPYFDHEGTRISEEYLVYFDDPSAAKQYAPFRTHYVDQVVSTIDEITKPPAQVDAPIATPPVNNSPFELG